MAVSESSRDELDLDAAMALRTMLAGGWIAQSIYLVAKLGIPDRLADGPLTSDELAQTLDLDADALHRLLRVLTTAGVFARDGDAGFGLGPLGRCLRGGRPGMLRALAIWNGEVGARVWLQAGHSVETGQPASSVALGMPMFAYLERTPELAQVFGDAMAGLARQLVTAILDRYDFAPFGTVVDVGGGSGAFLAAVLQAHPAARGVLFDLAGTTRTAAGTLRAAGVGDRCEVVAGDFFAGVPAGGDAYVLSSVLHDWSDEDAARILASCRRAMAADATLLVIECLRDGGGGPGFGELLDLQMLIMTGGRERSHAEYRALLERSGFRLTGRVDLPCPESVLQARPV